MSKSLGLLAPLLLLLSCQKEITVTAKKEPSGINSAAAKGSTTGHYTYLSVTVHQDAGAKIISDNGTPYVDGEQNVRAEIQHSSGEVYMQTNTITTRAALRRFVFPGNGDLDGKNDYRLRIRDDAELVDFEKMVAGESDEMVMRLWGNSSKGQLLFDIIFNPATVAGTVRVQVTKTDANSWEVIPLAPYLANIRRANTPAIPNEEVPFRITLKVKGT